jgi:hypothetical protein
MRSVIERSAAIASMTTVFMSGVFAVDPQCATGLYHHPDCPVLIGGDRHVFTVAEAKKRYFQPHCKCLVGKDASPEGCAAAIDARLASPPTAAPMSVIPQPSSPTPAAAAAAAAKTTPRVETTLRRCQATTKTGVQCSGNAQPGRNYCWQHP